MNINTTDLIQFKNGEIFSKTKGITFSSKTIISDKVITNEISSLNKSLIKSNGSSFYINTFNDLTISEPILITDIESSSLINNIDKGYIRISLESSTILDKIYLKESVEYNMILKRIGTKDQTYHLFFSKDMINISKDDSDKYYIDCFTSDELSPTDSFSVCFIIVDKSIKNTLERNVIFEYNTIENSKNVITIEKDIRSYLKDMFIGDSFTVLDKYNNLLKVDNGEKKESITNDQTNISITETYSPVITNIGQLDIEILQNSYFGLTKDIATVAALRTLIGVPTATIYPGRYDITSHTEAITPILPYIYKYTYTEKNTDVTIPFSSLISTNTSSSTDLANIFNGTTSAQLVNNGIYNAASSLNKLTASSGTINNVTINTLNIKKVSSTNTYPIFTPTNKIFVTRTDKVDIDDTKLYINVYTTILSTEPGTTTLKQEMIDSVQGTTPGTNLKLKAYAKSAICKLTYDVYQIFEPKNVEFKLNSIIKKLDSNIIEHKYDIFVTKNISDILKTNIRQDIDVTFTTLALTLKNAYSNSNLINGTSSTISMTIPSNTLKYKNNFLYKKMETLGTHKYNNFYFPENSEYSPGLLCPGISLPINPERMLSEIYNKDFDNFNIG